MLPGAYDALSARIIERAGFHAMLAGGYAANGACGEVRFNMSPDPQDPQPAVQIAGQAQMPAQAASQAGPQADSQPQGEE